jgi:hypothetical protein
VSATVELPLLERYVDPAFDEKPKLQGARIYPGHHL